MKRIYAIIFSLLILVCGMLPYSALANDIAAQPKLEEISFKNAKIDKQFNPEIFDYTITLDSPNLTPTLKSYKLTGTANIFVNYSVDKAKHQNGIIVTVQHNNGAVYYNFMYSNANSYENSANNFLISVDCNIGEVYPAINKKSTSYNLYVPNDLTELSISAATMETSATIELPDSIILTQDQEPTIPIVVTAGNGETRSYTFKVKRLSKTTEEVKAEMADPNCKSIVEGELFYQKPAFAIAIFCTTIGILLLAIFIFIAKRLTINASDEDEVEFFETNE